MYDVKKWSHIFKLDPNKAIDDESLQKICESGTDAVIVGGSDGVTLENVLNLLARIRRYHVTCVLEVSTLKSITPGFDLYFIPTVLNSQDTKWISGLHHQAIKEYGELMDWDEILVEGYCILNESCKAATLTNANTKLTDDDVVAYAMMAEKMFRMPIFYLEYSGVFADTSLVEKVKNQLEQTVLFYGGGIESEEQAEQMAEIADVIVVGNVIYTNLAEALATVPSKR